MNALAQRWPSASSYIRPTLAVYVGPMSCCSSVPRLPTLVKQLQPSANRSTINQRCANASMLSGNLMFMGNVTSTFVGQQFCAIEQCGCILYTQLYIAIWWRFCFVTLLFWNFLWCYWFL